MAKRLKQKFYTAPKDDDSEMIVLIKRLGQHIGFLEKKIDMLIEKSGEKKGGRGNYSSGSRKPYGKSKGFSRERSFEKKSYSKDGERTHTRKNDGSGPPRRKRS